MELFIFRSTFFDSETEALTQCSLTKHCIRCHGPDNKEVERGILLTLTTEGRVITGLVHSETESAITLRSATAIVVIVNDENRRIEDIHPLMNRDLRGR